MKKYLMLLLACTNYIASTQQRTYCNPINIDYGYTPFNNYSAHGKHRTTADPVIVNFRDTVPMNIISQGRMRSIPTFSRSKPSMRTVSQNGLK